MFSRGSAGNVKIQVIIEQVPILVSPSPTPDGQLFVQARVEIQSKKALDGKVVKASLIGERISPALEGVFGGASAKSKARFLQEHCEITVPSQGPSDDIHSYSVPLQFSIAPELPGSLGPLGNRSSSVRYYISARLDAGLFGGSFFSIEDVLIHRACRSDAEGIGSLVDTTTSLENELSCTAWTPRSVYCGSRARLELAFRRLQRDVEIDTIHVALREKQLTSIAVPAAYQQRPGESRKIESEFEFCTRTVQFPKIPANSAERPDTVILDLQLPKDQTFYRRTTTRRAGINLQHYFDITVEVLTTSNQTSQLHLMCDTILSLPTEHDGSASLPPTYNDSAPPNYYEHSLDDLYQKGDYSANGEGILFLTTHTTNDDGENEIENENVTETKRPVSP